MSISLSLVALRTSGVAPLGVMFDASGTTSTATSDPFKEILYYFDFGDAATAWTYGTKQCTKKNFFGPIAGHIFDASSTVTLYGYDGTNYASTTQAISVTSESAAYPTTATVCVSTSGNFAGAPVGAATFTDTRAFDVIVGARGGPGIRLLFCGGEVWTSNDAHITFSGSAWTIGSYGTGKASIRNVNTSSTDIIAIDSTANDGRIMDLDLDGRSFNQPGNCAIGGTGGKRITILRCDAHHINRGFAPTMGTGSGEWCIHENTYINGVANNSIAFYSPAAASAITNIYNYFSCQGNSFDCRSDAVTAETVRLPFMRLSVLANNYLTGVSGSGNDTIKLHNLSNSGPTWGGNYTELNVLCDNWLLGSDDSGSQLTAGPQNVVANEKLRNIIIDGNYFQGTATTQIPIIIEGQDFRVSNNIGWLSTGGAAFIRIKQFGVAVDPDTIKMYGNSVYCGGASFAFGAIDVANGTGHVAYNNIAYAPARSGPTMFGGTTGLTQSNNSTNPQVAGTNPWSGIPSGSTPNDFAIPTGSYAKDTGTTVPIFNDFFKTFRPQNVLWDKGASEFSVGTLYPWDSGPPGTTYFLRPASVM